MTTKVDINLQREAFVREALTWVRTPFEWGACVKGAGIDCGRFPAACANGAGVKQIDMNSFPQISPQWFLHKRDDEESPFIEQILRFTKEYHLARSGVPSDGGLQIKPTPDPGDIVVAKCGRDYAHSAIVIAWPRIVGAAPGHFVTEWQDIYRSPQYGTRPLRFFDGFATGAGSGADRKDDV